jgi:hypothetical protein
MACVDELLRGARVADRYTSGLSTEPTDPAISIATPPKRRSSAPRKKLIQSDDTQRFCASRVGVPPLKPSVSSCWLTLASVTIAWP